MTNGKVFAKNEDLFDAHLPHVAARGRPRPLPAPLSLRKAKGEKKCYNENMKNILKKSEWRKDDLWLATLAVIFFGVIVFTIYAIESNIDATVALGSLAPQNRLRRLSLQRPITIDPNAIAVWMTFDYLNTVFKLPPSYLKTALNITDPRYPRLTIRRFAGDQKTNAVIALTAVKAAVQAFLSVKNNATK